MEGWLSPAGSIPAFLGEGPVPWIPILKEALEGHHCRVGWNCHLFSGQMDTQHTLYIFSSGQESRALHLALFPYRRLTCTSSPFFSFLDPSLVKTLLAWREPLGPDSRAWHPYPLTLTSLLPLFLVLPLFSLPFLRLLPLSVTPYFLCLSFDLPLLLGCPGCGSGSLLLLPLCCG